jgi:hypothetical protein
MTTVLRDIGRTLEALYRIVASVENICRMQRSDDLISSPSQRQEAQTLWKAAAGSKRRTLGIDSLPRNRSKENLVGSWKVFRGISDRENVDPRVVLSLPSVSDKFPRS